MRRIDTVDRNSLVQMRPCLFHYSNWADGLDNIPWSPEQSSQLLRTILKYPREMFAGAEEVDRPVLGGFDQKMEINYLFIIEYAHLHNLLFSSWSSSTSSAALTGFKVWALICAHFLTSFVQQWVAPLDLDPSRRLIYQITALLSVLSTRIRSSTKLMIDGLIHKIT